MAISKVSVAVAGILALGAAAGAANAANVNIFLAGASAQRDFWADDLAAICSGTFVSGGGSVSFKGAGPIVTGYKVDNGAGSSIPDIRYYTCTIQGAGRGAIPIPPGLAATDVLLVQYDAEAGSVRGIAPFIPGNAAVAGYPMLDTTKCVINAGGNSCTVTGYCRFTDTAPAGQGLAAGKTVVDVGLSDMDPGLWASPDNWPYEGPGGVAYPAFAPQPSGGQLAAVTGTGTSAGKFNRVNGQVFALYVGTVGTTAGLTNLSSASARSILTGQFTTWDEVPEMAGGGAGQNIIVCRRDHGSGTEVATSVYFTGQECGTPGSAVVSLGNGTLPANNNFIAAGDVNEQASSDDLASNCLTKAGLTGNTIGIRSLKTGIAGARILTLDGIEADAHNAAAGIYPYAFDTWALDNSAVHGGKTQSLAAALIVDAKSPTRLPPEKGALNATGSWLVGAGNSPIVSFAGGTWAGNPAPTIALWSTVTQSPEEGYDTAGSSCGAKLQTW